MGLAAAIGIAEVAFSLTAVLQSVAIVGAVVSVVGTVTKNKTLQTIGMGLGLVGGLGALASGALGMSSTALFGSAGEAGVGAAGAAEGAIGSAVAGEGGWTVAAPDVVGSLDGAVSAAIDPATTFAANPAETLGASASGETSPGLINASSTTADAGVAGGTATAPTGDAALANTIGNIERAPLDLGATSAATGNTITTAIDPATGLATSLPGETSSGGILSTLLDYAGKHPTVAFGAVQGASSLLSGWTSTLTPAQVSALNAQAAANQAAANLTAQQTANLAMPKAVASSAPVTGAPQQLVPGGQPQQPGFINQAPPQQPVTGRAA